MIAATRPPDEPERLQKLRSTGLLDTEPESPFENSVIDNGDERAFTRC